MRLLRRFSTVLPVAWIALGFACAVNAAVPRLSFNHAGTGVDHVVASRDDSRVLTWGADTHGQLGDGVFLNEPRYHVNDQP